MITLAGLIADKRFPSLGAGQFALYLWVVQAERAKVVRRAVAFGWMFPAAAGSSPMRWHRGVPGPFTQIAPDGARVQLLRFNLFGQGKTLLDLLDCLLEGKPLREASARTGVAECPPEGSEIRLPGLVEGRVVVRPPVLLVGKSAAEAHGERCRRTSSPTQAVARCSTVFLLDKDALLTGLEIAASEADAAWACLAEGLESETGVRFSGPDAGRIGNIEVMDFPAGDAEGGSHLDFQPTEGSGPDNAVSVRGVDVAVSGLTAGRRCFLRCRLTDGRDVVLDELKEVSTAAAAALERFSAEEEVSSVELALWRDLGDGRLGLVCEQRVPLLRAVDLQEGILAGPFCVKGGWKPGAPAGQHGRKQECAESASEASWLPPSPAGYKLAPWTFAGASHGDRMRRLFPCPSEGRFFDGGWEAEFVDWLRDVSDGPSAAVVRLFDPQFDGGGVAHFLAKAGGLKARIEVLTSFSHRPKGAAARDEVVEACRKAEVSLPGGLRVIAIEPQGKAGESPFHERGLFVIRDGAVKGWSLSQSLQDASRRRPMLALPIPEDLMPRVHAAAEALLAGPRPGGAPLGVQEVWPEVKPAPPQPSADQPSFDVKAAADLLLGKPPDWKQLIPGLVSGSMFPDADSALQALIQAGLYDPKQDLFHLAADPASIADKMVKNLAWVNGFAAFRDLWILVSHILVRSIEKDATLELILKLGAKELAPRLREFVRHAPVTPAPAGTAEADATEEESAVGVLWAKTFEDVLPEAERLQALRAGGTHPWPLCVAVDALLLSSPADLAAGLEEALSAALASGGRMPPSDARLLCLILQATSDALAMRPAPELRAALAKSKAPLLRAYISRFEIGEFIDSTDGSAAPGLSAIEPVDGCLALAVLHERLCAQGCAKPVRSPKFERAVDMLVRAWPQGNRDLIELLARRMGGPKDWDNAEVVSGTLEKVSKAGKIKWEWVWTIWCTAWSETLKAAASDGFSEDRPGPEGDAKLAQMAARALYQLPDKEQREQLAEMRRLAVEHLHALRTPFLRDSDCGAWANALQVLRRIPVFMASLKRQRPDPRPAPIAEFLLSEAEIDAVLKRYPLGK